MFKRSSKDLRHLADPEKDCVPAPVVEEEEDEHAAEWQEVGAGQSQPPEWPYATRPKISGRAGLVWLERANLAVENLVHRLIGDQTLNPFYHTGTLAVFLLLVVGVTGLYLTIFYIIDGLGTGVAYSAVEAIDGHWLWLGRIMRGVHRYASGAAVIATLLHALRTLFQDRFRGARWLAWVTGMLLLAALWFEGLTGYWLVWDTRAQLILETVIRAINTFPSVGVPFTLSFISNEATDQTWVFFLVLLFAHIVLFALLGLFYWFHVLRLSRAKFLPPRYFMLASALLLVIAALVRPATSAAEADLARLPGALTFDPFFLFYLPATLRVNPAYFWGATVAVFALITAVPWLMQGKEPGKVVIDKDKCTGCTKCAEDCPYNAIVMLPRQDGKPHKLVAIENTDLCVSCGLCVGSCDGLAVSLTDLSATAYYQSILARVHAAKTRADGPVSVVFTCERHAAHGARTYAQRGHGGQAVTQEVIAVPCVGVLHPNVVGQCVDAGVAQVSVVGCPPDDCAQREGNLWIEARLNRTRLPRLKRSYAGAPITTTMLPPGEFKAALQPRTAEPARPGPALKLAHFLRGGLVLAAVLALQVFVTDIPYTPYQATESLLQLGMRHNGARRGAAETLTGPELAELSHEEQVEYLNRQQAAGRYPTHLRLEIDGRVVLDRVYPALGLREEGSSFAYEKFVLAPGDHAVRLSFSDDEGELAAVIDQTVAFAPGGIYAITFDPVTETFGLR